MTARSPGSFLQGYNAQAVVGPGQIVLAAELTQGANDVARHWRVPGG